MASFFGASVSFAQNPMVDLSLVEWDYGSEDCEALRKAADYSEGQQVQYLPDTYIFRQNKCSHFEAPFVYLLVGAEKALLIDTGATREGGDMLLSIARSITSAPLVVMHTHGHSDHWRGDAAFRNAENVEIVRIGAINLQEFFAFTNWPVDPAEFELGDRRIEILPVPGHVSDSVALYDPKSRFLITGDTVLPGRLLVNQWSDYTNSIAKLLDWVKDKPVSHVMGAHIEMSRTPNVLHHAGTLYQPNEARLPLTISDIEALHEALSGKKSSERIELGKFVVWPY